MSVDSINKLIEIGRAGGKPSDSDVADALRDGILMVSRTLEAVERIAYALYQIAYNMKVAPDA